MLCGSAPGERGIAMKDEDGSVCSSPEAQQQSISPRFSINIQSEFSAEEQRGLTWCRVTIRGGAVGKMKSGKASGESGILPEMVRAACCESDFMSSFLELVHDVWRTGEVPRDCCDVILVPIHKKSDLSSCDNWRFWMWLAGSGGC